MSLFNLTVKGKPKKQESLHPWQNTIKDEYASFIKGAHNSARNLVYPKPKERVPLPKRVTFTVIGNRVTKEFLYCVKLVQGLHKYRWKNYDTPVIRGCTEVDWKNVVWRNLKVKFGTPAHCLKNQVAVLKNNELIGGEEELQHLIEAKYIYHVALNYQKENTKQFANFIKATGRPCAYLHISIDKQPIGTLIFMLYWDILPETCENFLRLCRTTKGGYSGTPVHRIVKDGWIQCGGFGLKDTKMSCENFIVPHDKRGVLGMANAGRHTECSTQFFVLLQPSEWLNFRFVAFGQLIDGEETLRKIEQMETYYESPKADIIIYSTGLLNLDCQDIIINKGANEYIDMHIDDLVTIGEMFYAMLLENVFLEIDFRELKEMEMHGGEGADDAFGEYVDEHGNYIPENIRATRRFMRKKEEWQSQIDEKSQRISTISRHSKTTKDHDDKRSENNDFDVEDYASFNELEEYSYYQASDAPGSSLPKPTKPYYLALTDVPYPGEVDSNFDLKKLLKGDYCLETDLDSKQTNVTHKTFQKKSKDQEKILVISELISSYGGAELASNASSEDDSNDELESDEEKEIKKYLLDYGEKASFSGAIVKSIAKQYVKSNPLTEKRSRELLTDEEVRRIRMALQDVKSRESKKVSTSVQPWETHSQINRRMTGFVTAKDLAAICRYQVDSDDEDEDDKSKAEKQLRKVSVSIKAPEKTMHKIKRKQTGLAKPDLSLINKYATDEEFEEESDKKIEKEDTGKHNRTGVRIAPQSMNTEDKAAARPTIISKKETDSANKKSRPSVLTRLYDDIAIDEMEPPPTFKDYKPISEINRRSIMLTPDSTPFLRRNDIDLKSSLIIRKDSRELIKQKGREPVGRVSFDYVTAIDHVDRETAQSIRSYEYSKQRPTMSVAQYVLKNQIAETERKLNKTNKKPSNITETTLAPKLGGIRLPGDSPAYDQSPTSEIDLQPEEKEESKQLITKFQRKKKVGK